MASGTRDEMPSDVGYTTWLRWSCDPYSAADGALFLLRRTRGEQLFKALYADDVRAARDTCDTSSRLIRIRLQTNGTLIHDWRAGGTQNVDLGIDEGGGRESSGLHVGHCGNCGLRATAGFGML